VLDTLDTPDITPDAPAWAKPSRLSYALLKEHVSLTKLIGERQLVRWMIEKGTPKKVIQDVGIKVPLSDQIAGRVTATYLELSAKVRRLRGQH